MVTSNFAKAEERQVFVTVLDLTEVIRDGLRSAQCKHSFREMSSLMSNKTTVEEDISYFQDNRSLTAPQIN